MRRFINYLLRKLGVDDHVDFDVVKVRPVEYFIEIASSYNGYEREDAVRELGKYHCEAAFVALVHRVNDWVPQVRQAALQAVRSHLVDKNVYYIAKQLPMIMHLNAYTRTSHKLLIEQIKLLLTSATNLRFLKATLRHSDVVLTATTLQLLCEVKTARLQDDLVFAASHKDARIRFIVLRFIEQHPSYCASDILNILLQDPIPRIRLATFRLVEESSLTDISLESVAKRHLMHRNASVRSQAIRFLRNQCELQTLFDKYTEFLLAGKMPAESMATIRALAPSLSISKEVLSLLEASVKHWLEHGSERTQKQALLTLFWLLPANAVSLAIEHLVSRQRHLVVTSSLWLRREKHQLDANILCNIMRNAADAPSFKGCMRLASLSNHWERLIFLLSLLRMRQSADHLSPAMAEISVELIKARLNKWMESCNKCFVSITPTQQKALVDLLDVLRKNEASNNVINLGKLSFYLPN